MSGLFSNASSKNMMMIGGHELEDIKIIMLGSPYKALF